MSINFEKDMGDRARAMLEKMFADRIFAADDRTALLTKIDSVPRKQMADLARASEQPVTLTLHNIGDRKKVGGVVYELDENGWKRMPIGTEL